MDFPTDTLPRLKACNADIACADMWSRNVPSFRTVMRLDEPDEHDMRRSVPVPSEIADLKNVQDVDVCGMACTLIRTSFLKKMEDPWFVSAQHGEDASFCFVAKQKYGATIKCDFGVLAGHWGVVRMSGQEWSRDARNQAGILDAPEMMKRMGARNVA